MTTIPFRHPHDDTLWVVYARSDIFGRRTDGDTTEVTLVQDPVTQGLPQVSPDGRWLAYSSDEGGSSQVYVRPFPDTKVAKRQVSTVVGFAPRWSRSGRELFYYGADADGTLRLHVVDVLPGAAFTTGTPKPLFAIAPFGPLQTSTFDVSPDGQRFLFTRARKREGDDVQQDRLVIVQHFLTELKAKVP